MLATKRNYEELKKVDKVLQNTFCDYKKAFEASIENARKEGVPEEDILHNMEEIDSFFMD